MPNWSADDSARPPLPAEIPLNTKVGKEPVFVNLRLEAGDELLFALDTGAPSTILDKSLEAKLGTRLGSKKMPYGWKENGTPTMGVYAAPKLYSGNIRLKTGSRVFTDDLTRIWPGRPMMGILGMDCLQNYCIQLDFSAKKMRFLDPDHLEDKNLGSAFPLTMFFGDVSTRMNFFEEKNVRFHVDTADYNDGDLSSDLFRLALQKQKSVWTLQWKAPDGTPLRRAYLSECVLNSQSYTNLMFQDGSMGTTQNRNVIGLGFLARNLVTFNFPKRTMYLQRRNEDSIAGEDDLTKEAEKFLSNLKEKGLLPGWLQNEHGNITFWIPAEINPEIYPVSRTFNGTKNGDVSKYHYAIVKTSPNSAWKLQRAWQTDSNGKVLKEFPVP